MQPRMKNPAMVLDVNPAIQSMIMPIFQSGLPKPVMDYANLRIGQMNACELCLGEAMASGANDPDVNAKMPKVIDWREEDCFSAAERCALGLTEAITKLDSRYDSVPDELWNSVEEHFGEKQRAALVMLICVMNMFTRINVSTRQTTSDWR